MIKAPVAGANTLDKVSVFTNLRCRVVGFSDKCMSVTGFQGNFNFPICDATDKFADLGDAATP